MVIDVHNHCVVGEYIREVERDSSAMAARVETAENGRRMVVTERGFRYRLDEQTTEIGRRLEDMTAAGIDRFCLSISPLLLSYGATSQQAERIARAHNDGLAALGEQHPDRVIPMGTLPMQSLELALKELDRLAGELKFRTIMIGTNVDGRNVGDPEFMPLWERIEGLGLLVFFHPIEVAARDRLQGYHLGNLIGNPLDTTIAVASLLFGGILERFPALKFVFAHSGGYVPWIRGRWRHGQLVREEARVNIIHPIDRYLRMIYFDSLIHSPAGLEFLVRTVGPDRVVVGTDYAADMGDWHQVPVIRALPGLTEEERKLILAGNVERLIA